MEELGKKVKMVEKNSKKNVGEKMLGKKCWNNFPRPHPHFQHFIKMLKEF
jgi:hypothetical protein